MYNSKIDLESSCTKDEAIALLIGLGDTRIVVERYQDEIDEIPRFYLGEYLQDEYERFESEYKYAIDEKLAEEVIAEKLVAFNQIKELISKANICARYFSDEIAKGGSSAIRISQTNKTIIPHYTLNSIYEWWAKVEPKIPGSYIPDSETMVNNQQVHKIKQDENEFVKEGWSSTVKERNVYTTLAFLAEAYAKKSPLYKDGNNPNAKKIAEEIAKLAVETIRKVIGNALKIKAQMLHEKGE